MQTIDLMLTYRGRLGRIPFLKGYGLNLVVFLVLGITVNQIYALSGLSNFGGGEGGVITGLLVQILFMTILFFILNGGIIVRRMRDLTMNRFIPSLLTIMLMFVAFSVIFVSFFAGLKLSAISFQKFGTSSMTNPLPEQMKFFGLNHEIAFPLLACTTQLLLFILIFSAIIIPLGLISGMRQTEQAG